MSKGSSWRKWDFHVHTPFSVLKNEFGDPAQTQTWQAYFKRLQDVVSQKGIAAIGVTDYFSAQGYLKVRQEQLSTGFLADVYLFPNVELRIFPVTEADVPINIHVLFSPSVTDDLEDKFFSRLIFNYKGEDYSCTRAELIRLGRAQTGISGLDENVAFKRGVEQFKTTIGNIDDILRENLNLRQNAFVVVANSNHDGASGIPHSSMTATRENIYYLADAIFSANPKDREFFLGHKSSDSPSEIKRRFRTLKPCVHGSDAHDLESIGSPALDRYCWVKADVSWEGLRQILCEPAERVAISATSPEPDKSFHTIDRVTIGSTQINTLIGVDSTELSLNHSLVAIIGGRGSGKTALLDLVSSCFREGEKLTDLEQSFVTRLYKDSAASRRRETPAEPIPVEVALRSGASFSKLVGSDNRFYENADVTYLTQNHFEELSANPKLLYSHIGDLVFSKHGEERLRYDRLSAEVVDIEKAIQAINLEIEQLRRDVAGKSTLQTNLKQKEGEQEDYSKRLKNIEDQEGTKDSQIEEITNNIKNFKTKRQQSEALDVLLANLVGIAVEFDRDYRSIAKSVNNSLLELSQEIGLVTVPDELADVSSVIETASKISDALDRLRTGLSSLITSETERADGLEGVSKTIAEFQNKLNDIRTEMTSIQAAIGEMQLKEAQIIGLEILRSQKYVEMMAATVRQQAYLQQMIDAFEKGQDELLGSLRFVAVIEALDSAKYLDNLIEKADTRRYPQQEIVEHCAATFDFALNVLRAGPTDTNYDEITEKVRVIAQSLTRKKAVTESDLLNAVYSRYFDVGLEIKFSGKVLRELSMGERAVVLLKVLLASDDNPLLIDQPEGHLDNKYIYEELTPAFRAAKNRRQIIIASHNANLVVNTDAEQVIVAQHENGRLSYRVGTLENKDTRELIATILEGGEEAFQKREEKYGYRSRQT